LIATYYSFSPIAGQQLQYYEGEEGQVTLSFGDFQPREGNVCVVVFMENRVTPTK
jgi:uncharacterized protein (DUF2141 family)